MTQILDFLKEVYTFVNEMTDFVTFLAGAFGTVPTIFIVLFSLALLLAVVFGFFHLIVVIVTH